MRVEMLLKQAKLEAYEEGYKVGCKIGYEHVDRLVTKNLLEMGKSIDFIAKALKRTPQYVQQIIDELEE